MSLGEVVHDRCCVFSNGPKVGGPTSPSEKQQLIKVGEEGRGRLMNGANNGLATRRELSQETTNLIGGLAIETRGGLIEKEQRWFCDQFRGERQALALLD